MVIFLFILTFHNGAKGEIMLTAEPFGDFGRTFAEFLDVIKFVAAHYKRITFRMFKAVNFQINVKVWPFDCVFA